MLQESAKARLMIQERPKHKEHAVCGPEGGCVSLFIPRTVLQP